VRLASASPLAPCHLDTGTGKHPSLRLART
jgi:hypothetical protein